MQVSDALVQLHDSVCIDPDACLAKMKMDDFIFIPAQTIAHYPGVPKLTRLVLATSCVWSLVRTHMDPDGIIHYVALPADESMASIHVSANTEGYDRVLTFYDQDGRPFDESFSDMAQTLAELLSLSMMPRLEPSDTGARINTARYLATWNACRPLEALNLRHDSFWIQHHVTNAALRNQLNMILAVTLFLQQCSFVQIPLMFKVHPWTKQEIQQESCHMLVKKTCGRESPAHKRQRT